MSDGNGCIVSYIDLEGITADLRSNKPEAIKKIKKFHEVVGKHINSKMPLHSYAYSWNDAAVLLAYIDGDSDINEIIREMIALKKSVDKINGSYVICVRGELLPESDHNSIRCIQKHVYIKASSMAFANCFTIEKTLKGHRKSWYIDERIIKALSRSEKEARKETLKMLPFDEERDVYMYDNDPVIC